MISKPTETVTQEALLLLDKEGLLEYIKSLEATIKTLETESMWLRSMLKN